MIDFEKGMVNRGNWHRMQSAMQRAANGERIVLGFLGGSITQGSMATVQEKCYVSLVAQWWQQQFPNVEFINAGIGGTTSQFGAARVREDLLQYHPDVVFAEFSVNDECTPHFQETYEGLVRTILGTGAALMLIHNVRYDTMESAEDIHLAVGKHYDLPCVSMKSTIYPLVASGEIPAREITPDDLHPNDRGHAMVASVITAFLEKIQHSELEFDALGIPQPLTDNQYQDSLRYQNTNSHPDCFGFQPDHTPQEHITQMFRKGYTAWHKGDRIVFSVDGTGVAVQYRKSVKKPAPIAEVLVDGERKGILDANFQEDWGDCLYIDTAMRHGTPGRHTVEIEIVESHAENVVPFYLVSVIGSQGK